MFELLFGLIWTGFTAFMMWGVIDATDMSQANFGEFETIYPIAFLSLFLIVGICFMAYGVLKLYKSFLTNTRGIETCGYIADIYYNGKRVNHTPLFDARIIVVENGQPLDLKASIGTKRFQYSIGTYVNIKYYQNNAKILSNVMSEYGIPSGLKTWVEENTEILKANQMRAHYPFTRY